MADLWADIDKAVLACVSEGGVAPGEIGRRLGMSEAAATSILMMLAVEGKVRVCRVSLPDVMDPERISPFRRSTSST